MSETTDFAEVWRSVEALRQAVSGGFIKPGRDERATLALAAEIERLREHAIILAETARQVEQDRCAVIARNGCLVPPDGGSPTEDERLLCEEIERHIRVA